MYILSTTPSTSAKQTILIPHVDVSYLKHVVKSISIPRHYIAERDNNNFVRKWIQSEFESFGMNVSTQGQHNNIVASYENINTEFSLIIGAHYDSVPKSPGADDNASAIAGLLALAKSFSTHKICEIGFIAFNREEDGLLGSTEYVSHLSETQRSKIRFAHILEMIGYARNEPGTQSMPPGLPISIDDTGNFIGIIANRGSNSFLNEILKISEMHTPSLPVKCLKVFMGVEKLFPHLLRSDHAPFWSSNIPSLMWTDTSEFRNPNYHRHTDTPETLNYDFIYNVVNLLRHTVLKQLNSAHPEIRI
jgi:Zn-dependent M28 family amino/carboxypeptidase